MEIGKRALAGPGRAVLRRIGVVSAGVSLAGGPAAAGVGQAGVPDCHKVNEGALSVSLDAQASATRQVVLKAGDRLIFHFEAEGPPLGTLTLVKGSGAPRPLLAGPSGSSAVFAPAGTGAFAFKFAKEGEEAASYTVSCTSAGAASVRRAAADWLRDTKLPDGLWEEEGALDVPEAVAADPSAIGQNRGGESSPAPAAAAPPAPRLAAAGSALDVKLQWRGERYLAGGPDGSEIDNSTRGMDAALNYKLLPDIMVGALAQVEPPGESLFGTTTHGLLDHGWMAGPVANIKLGSGLTFDARAAWGAAESMPDELSAHTASIERRTVNARLANTQSFGPWKLTPSVSFNHFHETAGTAVSTAPVHEGVTASAAGVGRIDVGPELTYRIDMDKAGFIEPRAAIGTFWDFDALSNLAPGATGHGDMRLKAEAGVTIGAGGGTKLQAGGSVEEGAPGTANVWSGRLQLSVPIE